MMRNPKIFWIGIIVVGSGMMIRGIVIKSVTLTLVGLGVDCIAYLKMWNWE